MATVLLDAVDKAIAVQQPFVNRYVERLRTWSSADQRGRGKDGSPAAAIRVAERQYLFSVGVQGAAVGGVAAAPSVGTVASLGVSTVEAGTNLETTILYALACARIHGVVVDDLERRRTLLYAILLGGSGASTVEKMAERTGQHWGKRLVDGISADTLKQINKVLGRNFITKYGTKQGLLVLGKAVPFGLGAAIGAGGNLVFARTTIAAARSAFGPAPATWGWDNYPSREKIVEVEGKVY